MTQPGPVPLGYRCCKCRPVAWRRGPAGFGRDAVVLQLNVAQQLPHRVHLAMVGGAASGHLRTRRQIRRGHACITACICSRYSTVQLMHGVSGSVHKGAGF